MRQRLTVLLVLLVFGVCVPVAYGQRIYTFDAKINLVGSADDNPQVAGLGFQDVGTRDFVATYGAYPSITMHSQGPHSNLELFYAFGLNRVDTALDLNSESHTAGGTFKASLGPKWTMSISDAYRHSPDFATFDLFRGIVFSPQGVFFDFQTVSLRRNGYENTATLGLDYQMSPSSKLTFGLGHSVRRFESDPRFVSTLSNQNRYNGSFQYSRTISKRSSWNFGYSVFQNDFQDFENSRTHDVDFGFTHQPTPTVTVSLKVGPSYVESLGTQRNFTDFNASFDIAKVFESNRISFFFAHRAGASTGVGSISTTNEVGFNFDQGIARYTTLNFGLSAYETRQRLDNLFRTRGIRSSLILEFLITDNLSLNLGGSYDTQEGQTQGIINNLDLQRRRIFVSLQFALPEFWRVRK